MNGTAKWPIWVLWNAWHLAVGQLSPLCRRVSPQPGELWGPPTSNEQALR